VIYLFSSYAQILFHAQNKHYGNQPAARAFALSKSPRHRKETHVLTPDQLAHLLVEAFVVKPNFN